jgi:hypothetical protein
VANASPKSPKPKAPATKRARATPRPRPQPPEPALTSPPPPPPPVLPPPVLPPPPLAPPPDPAAAGRTAPLAVVSLVCSIAGLFVIPLLGGVVGAALGVAALVEIRKDHRLSGHGLAIAGTVVGLVLGVVPLAVLAYVERGHWSSVPFALTVAYGGAIAALLWRETAGRQRVAAGAGLLGGVALVALGALLAYLSVWLCVELFKLLFRYLFHTIGCAVKQSVNAKAKHCPAPTRPTH